MIGMVGDNQMTEPERIELATKEPIIVLEIIPGWYLCKSDLQFGTSTLNGVRLTCNPLSADDLSRLSSNKVSEVREMFPNAKTRSFRVSANQ